MQRFRLFGAVVAFLCGFAVAPAYALCDLCTAAIRLDAALADCFVQRAPDELTQIKAGTSRFVIVDLSDCGSRGSLPTGNPGDGPPLALDMKFAVDADGVACLSSAIAGLDDDAMTPSHLFDLTRDCAAP